MAVTPPPIHELFALLEKLDGQPFKNYRKLLKKTFYHPLYILKVVHIQGSPGAFPASVCHLIIDFLELGLDRQFLESRSRKIATADYLLRVLYKGILTYTHQNRGTQGSGSYQTFDLPPQVLERNLVRFTSSKVRIAFHISLPGSRDNRVLGGQAAAMFDDELNNIVTYLKTSTNRKNQLTAYCDVVEDMVVLQNQMANHGLVAFVADGSVLARKSGISQAPLKNDAVVFQAPSAMAVEIEFPNRGRARGLGIPPGVTVLIGGAFHGKSTLVEALAKSVYPHIPGDGRERVVCRADTAYLSIEHGRAISGLDISCFINRLPGRSDVRKFYTKNASGSTSQAASIIEAVQAGAKFLLLDEDSSATNFLVKDQIMRKLLKQDTITPFLDRVREFYNQLGVSTLIVVGGSSEYLGVADHVIAMQNYQPICMTERVKEMALPGPCQHSKSLIDIRDKRKVAVETFDPSYHTRRFGKNISVRIKPLRLQEKIIEYGNQQLDLTYLKALVDAHQAMAIGYALLLARNQFGETFFSLSELAGVIDTLIEKEGMSILLPGEEKHRCLARPRKLELAAAMNRFRNLRVRIID